ncbi:MAG TPA: class I SAM-dependent methyltransferase [Candidatus Acidoferrum sp.]|nr:class I SAM-dependent methyltransferase [Candidatus Acidoferrum sp.]
MEPREYETMARLEDSYWWYRGLRARLTSVLRAEVGEGRPRRILDVGCGTGANLCALHALFPASTVVGVDIADPALRHAQRRGCAALTRASAAALPFPDARFDVLLFADVLSDAGVDERAALGEAHRVLRRGGVLAANVPAFASLRGAHDAAVETARRYRRANVARLLVAAGFTIRRLTYWNTVLFPLAWTVRRLRRMPAGSPTSDLMPLPRVVNATLTAILAGEARVARWIPMPFGTSVLAVAAKRN